MNKIFIKKKNRLVEYSKQDENLLITPHIAGLTYESEYKAAMSSINVIKKLKHAWDINYSLYLQSRKMDREMYQKHYTPGGCKKKMILKLY